MRIERFQIQGFKSIRELAVEGLADINVFFGMNDVGKSNMFQALELWHWLLSNAQSPTQTFTADQIKEMQHRFGASLFQLGGRNAIHIAVDLSLGRAYMFAQPVDQHVAAQVEAHFDYLQRDELWLTVQIDLTHAAGGIVSCSIRKYWDGDTGFDLHPRDLAAFLTHFHIIKANRRLKVENRQDEFQSSPITDRNLKQALFYAYLSSDIEQKKRLNAIKRVLAEPPYSLGELDIALDPATDRIDIGFVRPDGRLPIENLGSGAQQLILVLGQIFLNDYPIIAVEEPEMNLSPQHQEHLMATLRTLMEDPAVKLQQLFVATHSPYLEFTDNFYDVTFDLTSGTQVQAATAEKYGKHFAITPAGPESGARLNSLNQVKLYEGVIQDLGLQRGDLVIFVRNEAGRWELRAANEVAQELQAVTNGNARP